MFCHTTCLKRKCGKFVVGLPQRGWSLTQSIKEIHSITKSNNIVESFMEIFNSSEFITNKEIDLNWHSQQVMTWVTHNEIRSRKSSNFLN